MRKVVAALDSFKGSLTSMEAAEAVREGIYRVYGAQELEVVCRPLADGGEGTAEALMAAMGAERIAVMVSGPLGERREGVYGYLPETGTAVIEMAQAAGLTLIPEGRRDPMRADTFGVGEMIADALGRGARRFLVGLGGSATNDCGTGMLRALGYRFLDKEGREAGAGGGALSRISAIDGSGRLPELDGCLFRIACDVDNPLCGPAGAAAVYAPQKGASPEMVAELERGAGHFAGVAEEYCGRRCRQLPGAGAAGGMGFAFTAFLSGALEPGIGIVLEETGLNEEIRTADLVITGEGRIDSQTSSGKAPAGVAAAAEKDGVPVVAFAGDCEMYGRKEKEIFTAVFPIQRGPVSLEDAMEGKRAAKNLASAAEQVFSLIRALENRGK